MSGQPRLVALSGPDDGREYPLDRDAVSLGRSMDHTVPILWDATVSRRSHACVLRRSGLYWLEDTGSTSGTYLEPPGAQEPVRLSPGRPVLLLEGAVVRLGAGARFQVAGVVASTNQAVQLLLQRLDALREGLAHLPAEAQERQHRELQEIECRLRGVRSEEELLSLAANGIATLSGGDELPVPKPLSPQPKEDVLPPLPEHLPEPGDPNRVESLQNVFLAHLGPIAGETDKKEGRGEKSC